MPAFPAPDPSYIHTPLLPLQCPEPRPVQFEDLGSLRYLSAVVKARCCCCCCC